MLLQIEDVGKYGIVSDIESENLPPEAWSFGQNVRMVDGQAEKMGGHTTIFTDPAVRPHKILPYEESNSYYWYYAGVNNIYRTDGANHVDVTSIAGAYNAGSSPNWTADVLNGVPIFNNDNAVDYPQQYNGSTSKFEDLSAWPADTYCKGMYVYKNYLVAIDITKSTENFPYLIKVSHPADPGATPVSWDESDASYDAIETSLISGDSTNEALLTAAELGDALYIYKEGSVWSMQFTGGQFVHRFTKVFSDRGALSPRAVAKIDSGHFCVMKGDVYVHDGRTPKSIITNKVRDSLFTEMSSDTFRDLFVTVDNYNREVWVCYKTSAAVNGADKAWIWNYETNTWGQKNLPDVMDLAMGRGVLANIDESFDAQSGSFDSDTGSFGSSEYSPQLDTLIGVDGQETVTGKFIKLNTGFTDNGSNFHSILERENIALLGKSRDGNVKVDNLSVKFIRTIYPKVLGNTTLDISVGTRYNLEDPISWEGPYTYDPSVSNKLDFRSSGRYISIKFEDNSGVGWKLLGYNIDLEITGLF